MLARHYLPFRGRTLRIADELPGGMTRTNVILAARNLHIWHPLMMDGITYA